MNKDDKFELWLQKMEEDVAARGNEKDKIILEVQLVVKKSTDDLENAYSKLKDVIKVHKKEMRPVAKNVVKEVAAAAATAPAPATANKLPEKSNNAVDTVDTKKSNSVKPTIGGKKKMKTPKELKEEIIALDDLLPPIRANSSIKELEEVLIQTKRKTLEYKYLWETCENREKEILNLINLLNEVVELSKKYNNNVHKI